MKWEDDKRARFWIKMLIMNARLLDPSNITFFMQIYQYLSMSNRSMLANYFLSATFDLED